MKTGDHEIQKQDAYRQEWMRFEAAKAALEGLLAARGEPGSKDGICRDAVEYADTLLLKLKAKPETVGVF